MSFFKRSNIIEIMHETRKAKLLHGRSNEDTGDFVGIYANSIDLNYIVVSSKVKGGVHEIGFTDDQEIAHMAESLKELEVFGD